MGFVLVCIHVWCFFVHLCDGYYLKGADGIVFVYTISNFTVWNSLTKISFIMQS